MTQSFTMAFTAKCAECSVYARGVQPVICQAFFYILYKESASPCFFSVVAVRVSLSTSASREGLCSTAAAPPQPFIQQRKHLFRSSVVCRMLFLSVHMQCGEPMHRYVDSIVIPQCFLQAGDFFSWRIYEHIFLRKLIFVQKQTNKQTTVWFRFLVVQPAPCYFSLLHRF